MASTVPDQLCPYCGYHFNRASNIEEPELAPKLGDIMLCLDCGEAGIFGDDQRLRKPTDEEHVEIAADPDYQKHRIAWTLWDQYGRPNLRRHP
jgi:hypothetical protein